ncbi:NAD(P)-dependent oxidoreductase [Paenibacillus sp. DXFW5]|uniref:NAD(P)-dependent oxidoreductase n=1 Tax=Paenibacillus rhizolycopersici TaxID=2780073 RepID=A0ABS2HCI9_9BACL|nr:NAD(P)-dependent oxidoreductase [Paenibacillus rhizolycopersici]MBM6997238.1 NAD(P)-dependent oxidoreductase [Paenibacillus rhizolycopersici]
MRKALVTGATGYIGSNLVKKLLDTGWCINILLREQSDLGLIQDQKNQVQIHYYDGSVQTMIKVLCNVQPDVVFHLASYFVAEHTSEKIDFLAQSNIILGLHLLEGMHKSGSNLLINTGTSWQHYNNEDYNPVCLYAATKQAFEDILAYYVKAKGIKSITLKLFDTYGSNDPRSKLLSLLKKTVESQELLGMSGGEQIINLVHVKDVVQAFLIGAERLLSDCVTDSEAYAISAKEHQTVKQLVAIIEETINDKLPILWGERKYREREVMVPWNRGTTLPGWSPEISLRDGLKEYFKS